MIEFTDSGEYKNTRDALNSMKKGSLLVNLDSYGRLGVELLSAATPVDTGLAANSWSYRITKDSYGPVIEWYNTDVENGENVIVLIQYGHGTGTGGFVPGRDFINPAIQEVIDHVVRDMERLVI